MNNNIEITEADLICNHREDITEIKNILIGTKGKLTYVCEICNCKVTTKWSKRGRFLIRVDEQDNIQKQVPNQQTFLKNELQKVM